MTGIDRATQVRIALASHAGRPGAMDALLLVRERVPGLATESLAAAWSRGDSGHAE